MSDGLPIPRRYFAVLTIWLAIAMAVLDGGVVNVALPVMARALGGDPASAIWVLNAYQLAMIVSLLPLAALGDRLGYATVYRGGLLVFTLGSLACALSRTLPELIGARLLQGLGAAAVLSVNTALVRFTYPRHLLGRGIGLNAVVVAIAAAAGPAIASVILTIADWRWIFAINLPIGVITLAIAARALPRSAGSGARLDLPSIGLNALAFGGVILGGEALARGAGLKAAGMLIAGVGAAILLARRELKRAAPLIPIDLLRLPTLSAAIVLSMAAFIAQMLAFIALPFFLHESLGLTVAQTGLLMTAWPVASGCAAPWAGRLADAGRGPLSSGAGLVLCGLGLALLAMTGPAAGVLGLVGRIALCGLGFGLFQSPNNRAIVLAAPQARAGAAGGLLVMSRLLGQVIGGMTMGQLFHLGVARPTQIGLTLAAGAALTAGLISLARLRRCWSARRTDDNPCLGPDLTP